MSAAQAGTRPSLQRLLDGTRDLTRTSIANLQDLTSLIDNSLTFLHTQVDQGPNINLANASLARLTDRMRELDPTVAELFGNGIRASSKIVDLLQANQRIMPVLLTNLLALNDVGGQRLPALRKTLVVIPWAM